MERRGDVAALDKLDLDDMFADEGDALFDGLDIDLDTMDDIAANDTNVDHKNSNNRRRKIKRPMVDDDEDSYSEERPKKKKKTKKKKVVTDELSMSLNSTATNASTSTSQTKSKQQQQATSTTKLKTLPTSATSTTNHASPINQSKPKRSKSRSKLEQEKEEYFRNMDCGISPSDVHFFPFSEGSAVPSDLALKSTRVFNSIHRMHSAFQSHLSVTPPNVQPVPETSAITKLMQEALNSCKKPADDNVNITIGNAIAAMRKIIRDNLDKNQMASDWYNACAILQRQYDFLRQNAQNMERFLRNHLEPAKWKEIYTSKLDLKGTFHVKLVFQGMQQWKDRPKGPLVASLGITTEAPSTMASTTASPAVAAAVEPVQQSLPAPVSTRRTYARLSPAERRQQIQDTLRQIVPKLSADTSSLSMFDIPKLPNEIPNTKTMWKWSERYFRSQTRRQLQHYIGELKEVVMEEHRREVNDETDQRIPPLQTSSTTGLMDRLQSLLVDVNESDNDEDHDDAENDLNNEHTKHQPQQSDNDESQGKSPKAPTGDKSMDEDDDASDEESFSEVFRDSSRLDVSALSEDQCVFLQLQRHGLADFLDPPRQKPPAKPNGVESHLVNGMRHDVIAAPSEIDDEISDLIGELHTADEINNKRLCLLEKLVQPYDERTRNYEMVLTAKCQQLLRKAKENRAKVERLEAKKKDETINTLFNLPPNR